MATAEKVSSKPAAKKVSSKPPAKRSAKRVAKTAAELKLEIEKTVKKLRDLQTRAYAETLHELIGKTSIVAAYKSIKDAAGDASDLVILAAIAKAVGVPRIVVTQMPAPKRAKKVETK